MQEYHKIVLLRCGYKNYEPGREPSVAEGMPAIVRLLWHFLKHPLSLSLFFYEVSLPLETDVSPHLSAFCFLPLCRKKVCDASV